MRHLIEQLPRPAILGAKQHPHWPQTKNLMLTMLGLWVAYFLVVNFFIVRLNKIIIPVIELPLGFYLAVQGSLVVFVIMLLWFARKQR